MRFKLTAILLTGILAATGAWSAWYSLDGSAGHVAPVSETIRVSEDMDTAMTISLPGIHINEKSAEGQIFSDIVLPEAGVLSKPGLPQLPAIRRNIIVPRGARVSLRVNVLDEITLEGQPVYPAQPTYKRSEPAPPFALNPAVYSTDTLYPSEIARISDDAVLRDFRFVTVTITPVRTNPVTGELRIATDLTIDVVTDGVDDWVPVDVFPSFVSLYQRHLDNFNTLKIGTRDDAEPMLIICYDTLLSDMSAFVEWKTKRGIDVTMVSSTETGTSSSAIQNYIQNVWATWDPQPVYIILVGDAPQLQPLYGIGSCASDSMFTLLEGSDDYPDTFISRLCAQNSTELNAQLDKILTYEMMPPAGEWLNKFSGLASAEGSSPSDEEYSQEVEARFLDHNPDASADRIYQSMGHGASEISAAVNDGRFWLSYFGHGSGTSWSAPGFTNSNVDALNNGDYTPFIMDVSCSNGAFDSGSDCFAERWVKGDGHGAMGMFSSSTSTAWDEPAVMAWGVTYSVTGNSGGSIPGGEYLLGQMTCNGILYMYDQMGTGSNTVEVMNQYVLFGDCSAMFRSDVFLTPDVSHLPTTPMAPMPFDVTVTVGGAPIQGAWVCAYKADEVHEIGQTDASGTVTLNISPVTIGDMIVTVYGQNIYPQESIVNVAPAGCGVVVLDRTGYNCDDTIVMSVFDSDLNTNPGSVEYIDVDVTSDSEPVPEYVTLTETGPDTAEFEGSIMTSDSQSGPGYLLVANGDTITVHYHDDDCNGGPADEYDSAGVDCQMPTISGVTVSNVGIDTATITWDTDEMANSVLYWGETVPPMNMLEDTEMVMNHEFDLAELDSCTQYYFSVVSTDPHGNMAVDDNGGAYYCFTTLELVVMLEANMDTDPGWTYENQWAWGVPQGNEGDPSSGNTGSSVVGYNLSGDYTNNMPETYCTTQSFDCSEATEVFFSYYEWLGVESSTWDHASLDVSGDGGSSWDRIWTHTGSSTSGGSWTFMEYDISSIAAGNSDVKIRWVMGTTDSSVTYCGWNVDDVLVSFTRECVLPTPTPNPCVNHGDVTLDGEITAGDAQMAFLIALGSYTPTYEEECAADCTGDGTVTAGDAQNIFLAALGLDSCADPLTFRSTGLVQHHQPLKQARQRLDNRADVLWTENVSGRTGDQVTVDVWIDNPITAVDVFTVDLAYNRSMLAMTDVRIGGLDPDWIEFGWSESDDGTVTIAAYNSGMDYEIPPGSFGTLVELTFDVLVDVTDTGITLLDAHDDLSGFILR